MTGPFQAQSVSLTRAQWDMLAFMLADTPPRQTLEIVASHGGTHVPLLVRFVDESLTLRQMLLAPNGAVVDQHVTPSSRPPAD